ncbi:MAG: chromosome partitioning ATPase [Lautropia sp.]|nr:chromosome partitioning ATPase [Lautropia sp.]
MNKRLIQRAMEKLADQQPTKGTLPLTIPTQPTDQTQPNGNDSAESDELAAAKIRAEIAKADALRQSRSQQRQHKSPASASPGPAQKPSHTASRQDAEPRPQPHKPKAAAPRGADTPSPALGRGLPPAPPATQPATVPGRSASASPTKEEAAPQAEVQPESSNAAERPHSTRPEAQLDFENLKSRGFLVPQDKTAKIHQEFRLIKRRLLDNAFGRLRPVVDNGRLIMITSSLPAEGKTFCSINLAISVAIGGEYPVLLVDADIARPSISNTLGLRTADEHGVADYLDDPDIALENLILNTSLPGLSLLPAGHLDHRPVDLLASANMAKLVDQLARQLPDHVIIFDSPPLLPVTETRSLSALVGQVMLVVAAGETPRNAVNEALLQLETCEAVGLLLNKAPVQPKAPAYYGY